MKQLAVLLLAFMFTIGAPSGANKTAVSSPTTDATLVTTTNGSTAYIPVTAATEATVETALETKPTAETKTTEPITDAKTEETDPLETEATETYPVEAEPADSNENVPVNEGDLELLARLIYVEGGCEWYPDWVKEHIGSVVLNRVNSDMYPNSIEGVIYDPGQYEPQYLYRAEPDENAVNIACQLLTNGSSLPSNVLGQNSTGEGTSIYETYYDEVLNETIYFTCL